MRRALDAFYRLGGALSALCLTLIMVLIVAQVLGRVLDKLLGWVGVNALGLNVPGLAELASFLLLGATFLALPTRSGTAATFASPWYFNTYPNTYTG